jgi:hypothetical protein
MPGNWPKSFGVVEKLDYGCNLQNRRQSNRKHAKRSISRMTLGIDQVGIVGWRCSQEKFLIAGRAKS